MAEWINNNMNWIFSGIGILIVSGLFTFLKCYTVVKRKDYKELKRCKERLQEYIYNDDIFKDLEYDTYDEVYFKVNKDGEKEFYCPICLKADKNRIHLSKRDGTIGNLFICRKCNNCFGKGDYPESKNYYEENENWFNY